jgi:hypothetical protein
VSKEQMLNDPWWQAWTDEFLNSNTFELTTSMSDNLGLFIVNLLVMEVHDLPQTPEQQKLFDENFLVQIFLLKAKYYELDISDLAILLIAGNCSNPGMIVMYVHAMLRLQDKIKKKIHVRDILKVYESGFPSEKTLYNLWEKQKCKIKNNKLDSFDNEKGGSMPDI